MANFPEQDANVPDDAIRLYMPRNLRVIVRWSLVAVGLILLFVLLSFLKSVYTDLLWFGQLGLRSVYVKILVTRVVLFVVGAVVMALLSGASLYMVSRLSRSDGAPSMPQETYELYKKLVFWGAVSVVIVLSVIFGAVAAGHWETVLQFSNGVSFDTVDPIYGRDISFFVFQLPLYDFIHAWLLGAAIVSLLATVGLYFVRYSLRDAGFRLTFGLKAHASVIVAAILLLLGMGHWLDRWGIVLSDRGAVFGAAYADVHVRKLALLILTIIAAGSAGLAIVNAYLGGVRLLVGAVALWIIMAITLGAAWPSFVQRFSVTPNEFVRERPYIERSIAATRRGFALDRIEEVFYPADPSLSLGTIRDNQQTVNNIRLWDKGPLTSVYKQIQLIRPYYDFKDADVDRYVVDGRYRQVLLAAREVAPEKLDAGSQTWINKKLIYTHGFGLAMSPATEFTAEGRPEFFARDIPSEGRIPVQPASAQGSSGIEPETVVTNPRIYFGENTEGHVIVNTKTDELDYQTKEGDLFRFKYAGEGGVRLSSFLRRLAYAWQFGDFNILISGETNPSSLIQYRRNIHERISAVAPFLVLDQDPYLVAADGQLFWIQDAYTTTDRYPYSDPTSVSLKKRINYIRNSVKVTVDAYSGALRFYVSDPDDPLVRTYEGIFPDLFTPLDSMPQSLRAHIRYPRDFFKFQADKYLKYHMREPQTFYNNEDLWTVPQEKFGQSAELQPVEPYYVIMRIPGEEREEFVLLLPYTPSRRQNLIGWLAARSDGEDYGKLIAFNFPKDRQIDGPEQVEARIDNDPFISAWFTLRCQAGSFCIRGNLLVVPVGTSLLYAEPIYLQAEGVEFPELKQVILATAERVVMAGSVEEAVLSLTSVSTPAGAGPGPAQGQPAAQPTGDTLRAEIDSLDQTIRRIKDDLAELEEALKRLRELSGGE